MVTPHYFIPAYPPFLLRPPSPSPSPPQSVSESYQQDGGDDAAVEDQSLAPINEASGLCGQWLKSSGVTAV